MGINRADVAQRLGVEAVHHFDPPSAREMQGSHFGLVLSGKGFNQQGLAMICPISQGAAAAART